MEQIPPLPKDWERWLYKVGITKALYFLPVRTERSKSRDIVHGVKKMVPIAVPKAQQERKMQMLRP